MGRAVALYAKCTGIIDRGVSTFHGTPDNSYVDPIGWQAVLRTHGDEALLVAHAFGGQQPTPTAIPLPEGNWKIADCLADAMDLEVDNQSSEATMSFCKEFSGGVCLLVRSP